MHERLSTLEKQMQGALDFVDDRTERDARNVRINCVYLRLVVTGRLLHSASDDSIACLRYETIGRQGRVLPLVTDFTQQHRESRTKTSASRLGALTANGSVAFAKCLHVPLSHAYASHPLDIL